MERARGFSHMRWRFRGVRARMMGSWVESRVHMNTPVMIATSLDAVLLVLLRLSVSYWRNSVQSEKA